MYRDIIQHTQLEHQTKHKTLYLGSPPMEQVFPILDLV